METKTYALTETEEKFAALIWHNEPLSSTRLAALAEQAFGWKKSTTYTMLKRLENKQVFANDHGTVRALVSAEQLAAAETAHFVQKTFGGSLPRFLAAFSREKALSAAEVDALQRLIDDARAAQKGE